MRKTKILFLTQTLGGGGAERVLVNLVNNMDIEKYDITVQTLFAGGVNSERLRSEIRYIQGNAKAFIGISRFAAVIPSTLLYKMFVKDSTYDIVVSFMHGLPTKIILGAPKKLKRITWLHSDANYCSLFDSFLTDRIAIHSLKQLDAIVCVSKYIANGFIKRTGITDAVTVCYNVNDTNQIRKLSEEELSVSLPDGFIICSVGRFTEEKGFERLINISLKLNANGYDHTLLLIGGGSLLESLKEKYESPKIVFTGFQANPYAYMKKANMYVCSSYFEGLSTATTEAIILGKPCVSTDVSGAREILGDSNEYGLVVENTDEALYQGIKEQIQKIKCGEINYDLIASRGEFFDLTNMVKGAEDVFERLCKQE